MFCESAVASSLPWEHPRTSFQGSLTIRTRCTGLTVLQSVGMLLSQTTKGLSLKPLFFPAFHRPLGLPSRWQVMSYFGVMGNHSSSAFPLINTPGRGRHTNTVSFLRPRAFVFQVVHAVSWKGFNERASPSLSNGQKSHGLEILCTSPFALRVSQALLESRSYFHPSSADTV